MYTIQKLTALWVALAALAAFATPTVTDYHSQITVCMEWADNVPQVYRIDGVSETMQ